MVKLRPLRIALLL